MGALAKIEIPAVVGVIASPRELQSAKRMRLLPDLFELRLDFLPMLRPSDISKLRRPLIITARHPLEGGNKMSASRRDLLLKFLPSAQFLDLELRSLRQLREVWAKADRLKLRRICSVHDFAGTPSHAHLRRQCQRARNSGADIFKLVTRAETPDDFLTLMRFLRASRQPTCIMAIGQFGPASRLVFPECGSVLVYAPLHRTLYNGQLTLPELRRWHNFYAKN